MDWLTKTSFLIKERGFLLRIGLSLKVYFNKIGRT